VSGQGGIVRENAIVAYQTIMRNMAIGHYKTIIPNYRFHPIRCTLVYGSAFPYSGVVTDYDRGFFAFIL
jgi:hypothetical protein